MIPADAACPHCGATPGDAASTTGKGGFGVGHVAALVLAAGLGYYFFAPGQPPQPAAPKQQAVSPQETENRRINQLLDELLKDPKEIAKIHFPPQDKAIHLYAGPKFLARSDQDRENILNDLLVYFVGIFPSRDHLMVLDSASEKGLFKVVFQEGKRPARENLPNYEQAAYPLKQAQEQGVVGQTGMPHQTAPQGPGANPAEGGAVPPLPRPAKP
ncbi:MAG: hypothetical protein HQL51_05555 [Magnetococcales bacterium]|nr:hypothetical protein [Magnetococcales bacterium]